MNLNADIHPEFFEGLTKAYPSFAPWKTPAYSNIAYQLLSYAVENISGKKFEDIVKDRVMKPLGLNRTYYQSPDESVGMIPRINATGTGWYFDLCDENP